MTYLAKKLYCLLLAAVIVMTTAVQFHHHDCLGNIFIKLSTDTELIIGLHDCNDGHIIDTCQHDDCESSSHDDGECSLHFDHLEITKSLTIWQPFLRRCPLDYEGIIKEPAFRLFLRLSDYRHGVRLIEQVISSCRCFRAPPFA